MDFGHGYPSGPCNNNKDIEYDVTKPFLTHLLTNIPEPGRIATLKDPDMENYKTNGVFKQFSQKEFIDADLFEMTGLADHGWVYYPKQCYDGSVNCKVHLKLAGCGGAAYVSNWILSPPDSKARCYP